MVKKKWITQCINDEKRKCNSRLNSFKEANVLVYCACIVSITLICDSTVNLRLLTAPSGHRRATVITLWFKNNFIYSINKFIPSLNKPTAVRPNWPQPRLWSARKIFANKIFLVHPFNLVNHTHPGLLPPYSFQTAAWFLLYSTTVSSGITAEESLKLSHPYTW